MTGPTPTFRARHARRTAGLACAALLAGGLSAAHADSFTLRVGAGHPAVLSYVSEFSEYFIPTVKERVESETDHNIDFMEAYGGSAAKLPEVFDAVESGLLDIGLISTPFEPSNLFLQNFGYRAPFGESDPVEAGKITRQLYEDVPELETTLRDKNQELLAILNSSNYALITNFPWESLADLDGHKIQAAGANIQWLNNTGATPVQGGLSDTYNGIQTGVFDGMLIHYQGMDGFKLYEVAPYVAKLNFGSLPINIATVNTRSWDRLPPEVQAIMKEVGIEYEQRVNAINRDLDTELLASMQEKGATILEIDPAVEEEWASRLTDLPRDATQEGEQNGLPMGAILKEYTRVLSERGNKAAAAYGLN